MMRVSPIMGFSAGIGNETEPLVSSLAVLDDVCNAGDCAVTFDNYVVSGLIIGIPSWWVLNLDRIRSANCTYYVVPQPHLLLLMLSPEIVDQIGVHRAGTKSR